LPASGCEVIAKVRRRAISSVGVLINQLWLFPGYMPSLVSALSAPAFLVDMMGARLFAKKQSRSQAPSDFLQVHGVSSSGVY
jgi:hypothetical protein